jgi:cell wall-associated NlpC family hydrolase
MQRAIVTAVLILSTFFPSFTITSPPASATPARPASTVQLTAQLEAVKARAHHHQLPQWRYVTPRRLRALHWAEHQAGKSYCWGGTGPSCYDCSGLVMTAYQVAGFDLPRTTFDMQASSRLRRESFKSAMPGDIILFGWPAYHAAIYVGRNQLFSASTYGTPIGFSSIWWSMNPQFYRVIGANVWRRYLAVSATDDASA